MPPDPILLVGGSGTVGRHAAGCLCAACQEVPLLIGRNLAKAQTIAEGATLDLAAHDLGIGDQPVSTVAVLLRDEALSGFRFARERGLPYIGISMGIDEIGPDVAGFMSGSGARGGGSWHGVAGRRDVRDRSHMAILPA